MTKNVSGAEAITLVLKRAGVDTIFGIPGGYLTEAMDAWKRAGLKCITGRHEGAVACMAAGYAQASGKLGVIFCQAGPGPTNALTGIASAYMDSVPLMLINGQVTRKDYGRDGHQEATGATRGFDQLAMFESMTQYIARPPDPESLVRSFKVGVTNALAYRSPVVIDVFADLFSARIDIDSDDYPHMSFENKRIDQPAFEAAIESIKRAKNPIVVMGNRVCHIGIGQELQEFCEALDIPFATVDYAKGIIAEDHPLCLGVIGQGGHGSVTRYMENSDCVILLGARLNHATTIRYDRNLFKNIIQFDDEYCDIGRSLPINQFVVGDFKGIASAMSSYARTHKQTKCRSELVNSLRNEHATYVLSDDEKNRSPLRMPEVYHELRQAFPREAIIVSDTGLTALKLKAHFPVYSRDGFYALYALAAMGSGLPMAMGVKVALPNKQVISVIGDGGFLTHVGELHAAVQFEIGMTVVVVKNGFYKSVSSRQEKWFNGTYATELPQGEYANIARSFGCKAVKCTELSQIKPAVMESQSSKVPFVIEIETDPSESLVETMSPKMIQFCNEIWKNPPGPWPFD